MVPDVESIVFSTVATAIRAQFPGIFVSGEHVAAPSSFPAVTLVEDDNSTYTRGLDLSRQENHTRIMYTANAYSTKTPGKKSECKAIMAIIDQKMSELGFLRIGKSPMDMPNAETSIYRMVARYRAVVSKTGAVHKII